MISKFFKDVIKFDSRDSKPDRGPRTATRALEGAPNILFVLYDDTDLANRDLGSISGLTVDARINAASW